ncbi:MAG: DegQ family serine endoprotease [Alphaproteobacteria bacterium]|nr:DegQ family serine endoprotease [Alphaproteobacteria bacterium]
MKHRVTAFSKLIVLLVLTALAAPMPAFAHAGPEGFADLAAKLLPAVVNISTSQTISDKDEDGMDGLPPDLQLPPGSPFEDFFKDFMQKHGQEMPRHRKATALGSGFIIDATGYIVTNNHVIDGADSINVILQDDTNLTATVVGRDKKTDIALLKVTPKKPLTAVTFGDSDKIRVGDWILAIGNPYGLGGTVTAGIISARARDIQSGPYDEFLQTDAPINRGNSGGPMFDMDGNVVGINTAIFSPSGGSIGIGFAIPSVLAKNIVDQLKASGHIRRGWLGVHIQNVTQDIADGLGMPAAKGALVSSVNTDGPAAKAGILPGDVITSFDGKDVPDMHRLPLMVAETDVDKDTSVVVFRKGQSVTLRVKVGEMKGKDAAAEEDGDEAAPQDKTPSAEKVDDLGLSVAPLTDALRTRYGIKKTVTGLVVITVTPDGVAADQGLATGDVISEASQKEVKSAKDLADGAKAAKKDGKPLLLLINRKDELQFVAVSFPKKKEGK